MPHISLIEEAHKIIANKLKTGDIAIDATCGNGHDTLFLAHQVGHNGKVYGFDIQQRALDFTALRLKQEQQSSQVELILAGHEQMEQYIPLSKHQEVSAIMFNLGYLPKGDKSIITQAATTVDALNAASRLLNSSGLITIIAYPGHPGGRQELEAIQIWLNSLEQTQYQQSLLSLDNGDLNKPRLFSLMKK